MLSRADRSFTGCWERECAVITAEHSKTENQTGVKNCRLISNLSQACKGSAKVGGSGTMCTSSVFKPTQAPSSPFQFQEINSSYN